LRAGMSTVLRVHNQEASPQIVIPSRAVVEQMGEYFVFIAKDTVSDGQGQDSSAKKSTDTVEAPRLRAFEVKVQLGQTIGANVVVRSGINEGDKIVIDGVQAIHEGSEITTASSSRQAPGSKGSGKKGSGQKQNAGN
jgi:membrane fusion protein, multidrug efflux system